MKKMVYILLLVLLSTVSYSMDRCDFQINVHVDKPTIKLPETLYGIFLEDINYAADGGLYAEMLENRSFEYFSLDSTWKNEGVKINSLKGWDKIGNVELAVIDKEPLNDRNCHYLEMIFSGAGGMANSGYDGLVIDAGRKYDFSVFVRAVSEFSSSLQISIRDENNNILDSEKIKKIGDKWEKHEAVFSSKKGSINARLVIESEGNGKLCMDMVSLFPRDTFKDHKNGLRKDLAQTVADLEPKVFRFPGGCIAHGCGLANAYRWKDTVGPVEERKPNWNRWGYHQTYGLGFFEYFQFCEDIGAEALPVIPVGVSCGFTKPFDKVPINELQPWIDDATDLVEFANGSKKTKWGKIRADMGHPKPFNLKYICLGNEEHDVPEMRERFPYFVKALRDKCPEIQIIGTSGLGPGLPLYDLMTDQKVDISDEHYYMSPDWFIDNADRFDAFDRSKPKIFVGEYASQANNQYNAVAEAYYLTGIERNADMVVMTAYAPLVAHKKFTQWKTDLIFFDKDSIVKTPNYYVQQMFSLNKGDVYLQNSVERITAEKVPAINISGKVGVGTWNTAAEFDDVNVMDGSGKVLFSDDFSKKGNWSVLKGSYKEQDGCYVQANNREQGALSLAPQEVSGKMVYSLRARKISGDEGFLIVFGAKDSQNMYWWNIGGWGNKRHGIEFMGNNGKTLLTDAGGSVETGKWYDLRIETEGSLIRCFLDGKKIHDFDHSRKSRGIAISSTYDEQSKEVILKIVNPAEESLKAGIILHGVSSAGDSAQSVVLSAAKSAHNTFENRNTVEPKTGKVPAGREFSIDVAPVSVQVLRVPVKK